MTNNTTRQTDKQVTHASLYEALAAAQSEMGRALKDSTNPHFKSKYADLASVMDACMPALTRHGIAVLQPAYDEDGKHYIKTILAHGASGETIECRVPLIVAKNDMQGYGSAATYARRYGLMGMAGIAPEDDDGNAAAKAPPPQYQVQAPMEMHVSQEAIDHAKTSLRNAGTIEQLQAIFVGLPREIKSRRDIIEIKDVRKAELSHDDATRADRNGDLDDEIPDFEDRT